MKDSSARAAALANRINAVWNARGYPGFWAWPEQSPEPDPSKHLGLRIVSRLRNGLPDGGVGLSPEQRARLFAEVMR
jgi:hypothetical protein